ncbi:Tm-1-like ATP-binding domain-containing protein [Virgibacillus sp. NKC19-3]|uniref:Tm-1-like ATP-binding domain-containing protein n=1 Tax=Virgibacillus saliphilus TaxID=2831674 RepID=UPI001C9A3B4B|nr:Tm-1-like ATP-binding domain-containing protein [Virgibacillus sp. NKC19-3]MBY7144526.1 Tm-1-like ATP-binding domain-containing protein [Virgibacillus sp. NKC19-3]
MAKTIALAGTLDTKGKEYLYVKELIESLGFNTFTMNTGVFEPEFEPDVSNEEIMEAAGEDGKKITAAKDRAKATEVLAKGMKTLVPKLYQAGKFDGILSFGGSGGTSIVTPGMQALPVGVPKVMVSTLASGNTKPYVGTSDIVMIPSIVDVAGLNTISTKIFSNAVYAIAGMLSYESDIEVEKKPLIAATMFGLTTPCVNHAKSYLESKGYEVLIFHATGVGGRAMEDLIEQGFIDGVLDITTTEWADEIVGGVLNAGPHRLEMAAKNNIPQVVSVGALDMVNFGPYESVPEQFAGRQFYKHNPTVTLMRTTMEENKQFGEKMAEKLNMAEGATALLLPLKGLSGLDVEGQAFHGPEENKVLFDTLKEQIDKRKVEVFEFDMDVNNALFAEAAAEKLIALIENKKGE